ncbi:hypothetical protein [Bifidobacterium parmae]|uniref:Uncharacterized protein n=1 Tax=Bifidobacterium parmae TaxID=361854 RepID=A0A2N5J4R2_9BIFI|nr:hypothetical protein [Bifidobacterium parmae]PLS29167.1 hypothetical protein Uis4E_0745 [Bifidobacterium parmae]
MVSKSGRKFGTRDGNGRGISRRSRSREIAKGLCLGDFCIIGYCDGGAFYVSCAGAGDPQLVDSPADATYFDSYDEAEETGKCFGLAMDDDGFADGSVKPLKFHVGEVGESMPDLLDLRGPDGVHVM